MIRGNDTIRIFCQWQCSRTAISRTHNRITPHFRKLSCRLVSSAGSGVNTPCHQSRTTFAQHYTPTKKIKSVYCSSARWIVINCWQTVIALSVHLFTVLGHRSVTAIAHRALPTICNWTRFNGSKTAPWYTPCAIIFIFSNARHNLIPKDNVPQVRIILWYVEKWDDGLLRDSCGGSELFDAVFGGLSVFYDLWMYYGFMLIAKTSPVGVVLEKVPRQSNWLMKSMEKCLDDREKNMSRVANIFVIFHQTCQGASYILSCFRLTRTLFTHLRPE